jgi:hypothetical protein
MSSWHRIAFLTATLQVLALKCPALAQGTGAAPSRDEVINTFTQGRAAAQLLAAMEPDLPVETKVRLLIDRLVLPDRKQVQCAVTALVLLGPRAVPEMVRRIDDRRKMVVRVIAFRNHSPDAFEAVAQLDVREVIDCLNYILTGSTGEQFGSTDMWVGFGRTERDVQRHADAQRAAIVKGWRGYIARPRATSAPGKSLPRDAPVRKGGKK